MILARNRYRWFGTLDSCRVPTPDVRRRFLE
jgi:predicted DCC family thiol-disulfide oxidoreductase YuxK